jgi:hypothetical protein
MAKAMGSCGKSYPIVKEKNKSTMERSGASVANAITASGKAKGSKVNRAVKIKAKELMKGSKKKK